MTRSVAHAAYAAGRINSNLKGSTKQFGWLQASATRNYSAPVLLPLHRDLWHSGT